MEEIKFKNKENEVDELLKEDSESVEEEDIQDNKNASKLLEKDIEQRQTEERQSVISKSSMEDTMCKLVQYLDTEESEEEKLPQNIPHTERESKK